MFIFFTMDVLKTKPMYAISLGDVILDDCGVFSVHVFMNH